MKISNDSCCPALTKLFSCFSTCCSKPENIPYTPSEHFEPIKRLLPPHSIIATEMCARQLENIILSITTQTKVAVEYRIADYSGSMWFVITSTSDQTFNIAKAAAVRLGWRDESSSMRAIGTTGISLHMAL